MKKILTLTAAALTFAGIASAAEFGVILSDNTKALLNDISNPSAVTLEQKESISASLKIPFTNSGTSYFVTEIFAEHDLNFSVSENKTENDFIADLSLFKFSSLVKFGSTKNLLINAGRFSISDLTGNIFSQVSDGLFVKYSDTTFKLSAYTGYTGLLNAKNTSMLRSDSSIYATDKICYGFADAYSATDIAVEITNLFKNNSLSFEALSFFGLQGLNNEQKDSSSRLYATASLGGQIVTNLFYGISSSVQIKDFNFSGISNFSKANLTLFTDFFKSTVSVNCLYASGANGALSEFNTFTKATASYAADEPLLSGIAKAGISATILPVKNLFLSAGTNIVADCKTTKFNLSGVDAELLLNYQIFSDMKLILNATGFFGIQDSVKNNCAANLVFSIAL